MTIESLICIYEVLKKEYDLKCGAAKTARGHRNLWLSDMERNGFYKDYKDYPFNAEVEKAEDEFRIAMNALDEFKNKTWN